MIKETTVSVTGKCKCSWTLEWSKLLLKCLQTCPISHHPQHCWPNIRERKHVIVVVDLQLCGIFRRVSFTEISAFSLTPSFHLLPWCIFQPVPGLILLIGGLRLLNADLPLIISDHYVYLINLLDALLVSPPHLPLLSFLFCHISGSMWKIGLIIHLMSQEKMKILS